MTTERTPDCFEHETWHKGPHGGPADDLSGVILAEFNSDWEQDHWETLIVRGTAGDTLIDHPSAGFHAAPGGELIGWNVCKGYDHPAPEQTTTTAVEQSTTTQGTPTTSEAPSATTLVPSSTIPPQLDLEITVCADQPELCLTATTIVPTDSTLPATGLGDSALGLGGGALLLAGVTLALIARRRSPRPIVSEPASNITGVRPVPFDWENEK